jgi:hypothetical protein
MKIHATLYHEVEVNPIDVLQKLIEDKLGSRTWVIERDGSYFEVYEDHRMDVETPISKGLYDYIRNLEQAIAYLKKK